MRLIFKVVIGFVVVAALSLAVLVYLEQREGFNTPASVILDDIKDAGESVGESIDGFLTDTGLKEGAASLLEEGAALIKGETPDPGPAQKRGGGTDAS